MTILGGIVKKRLLTRLTQTSFISGQLKNYAARPEDLLPHFLINIFNILL
jgi:hypothetical protein